MRRRRTRTAGALLGVLTLLTLSACSTGLTEWPEGSVHHGWRVVFHGHGQVTGDDSTIVLEPNSAADPDITHGGLVVTEDVLVDTQVSAAITTEEQLRTGSEPNPWEVGWLLWRYSDPDRFYAIALKPNGWELTKQDVAYPGSQRFLASGRSPTFAVGETHTVWVEHRADTITVQVDGAPLVTFTDEERPYSEGSIGLYTEDAQVAFTDIQYQPVPGPK